MKQKQYDIALIGAGNVAWHLGRALQAAGHTITEVYSRTFGSASALGEELGVPAITKFDDIDIDADIYIIALKDYAIDEAILSGWKAAGRIVVHTSGTVPLLGLERISDQCGIFYPLQTFTKDVAVDMRSVPMLIEASNKEVRAVLEDLGRSICDRVEYLDSDKRKMLHIAAVFTNNFSNYLYTIAEDILGKEDLSFDLLVPLMKETVSKLQKRSPSEIQTGPATRNDLKTIDEHLQLLQKMPHYREIYLVMTESILLQAHADSPVVEDIDFDE